MATSRKKAEATEATEQKVTPNSLRSQAERFVLEAHRDEYYAKAEELFTANGMTFTRRSTPEERASKKAEADRAKAQAKLDKLLAEHPELAERLAPPTVATGNLDLQGDLSNTGAVGA